MWGRRRLASALLGHFLLYCSDTGSLADLSTRLATIVPLTLNSAGVKCAKEAKAIFLLECWRLKSTQGESD